MRYDDIIEKMASMAIDEGYAYELDEIAKEAGLGRYGKAAKKMVRHPIATMKDYKSRGVFKREGKQLGKNVGKPFKYLGETVAKHPYRVGAGAAGAAALGGGAYAFLHNRANGDA